MFTRNKLLFLFIGSVLLIGLLSSPDHQHENKTPWNIQRLPDGHVHVFGITPGKTNVQEANQILGHFADIRLYNTEPARLMAIHEHMQLGDETARIDLQYAIDEVELASMQQTASVFSPCKYLHLNDEQNIALLNTPITRLIYTPTINYDANLIERHFGDADEIKQIDAKQQIWVYKKYNLTVFLNQDKPDVLVFTAAL